MWQIRYNLDKDSVILFFRAGVGESVVPPKLEWGVAILRDNVRDEIAERQLLDCPNLAGKIHQSSFGGSPFLCVLGPDIDAVTDQARALLAQPHSRVAGG
jgi:hypothetical protein